MKIIFFRYSKTYLPFFCLQSLEKVRFNLMFDESAKLRALRAHVPTCLACFRAHLPMCLACLCAHMPTCLACLRAEVHCVLTCSRANLSCVLTCSRAYVLCVLTYSHVNVLCISRAHGLPALRAHVPTCLACFVCLRAHVL